MRPIDTSATLSSSTSASDTIDTSATSAATARSPPAIPSTKEPVITPERRPTDTSATVGSYRSLPSDYPIPVCSGRTELCEQVPTLIPKPPKP